MLFARYRHSCVLLVDQFNQKKIVVAGGSNFGGDLKSTEIYDLNTQVWTPGPDLPTTVYYSSMVTASPESKYAAYLVGGYQGGSYGNKIFSINNNMVKFRISILLIKVTPLPFMIFLFNLKCNYRTRAIINLSRSVTAL